MNEDALMTYISYHLHTYVKKYSYDGKLLQNICMRSDLDDPIAGQDDLIASLCDIHADDIPRLSYLNEVLLYSTIPTPEHLYLVGPVQIIEPLAVKHMLSCPKPSDGYSPRIFKCSILSYFHSVLFIYNLYRMTALNETTLMDANGLVEDLDEKTAKTMTSIDFEKQENMQHHNPYSQEVREQSSIENGDLEGLERSITEDYAGTLGKLSKDELRNIKNTCIVVITLASRSAIRGGVSAELSFSLSDNYIQQIEEGRDLTTVMHLTRNAERYYTSLVHDIQERKGTMTNPKVRKCKDYIFSHLHDRITATDLADFVNMSPNYLSQVFKECEGITLSEFIMNEKINRAKNMLTYSDYSYIEIATYLGFSSQSHLGKQFKAVTGFTLKQYRDQFGQSNF